MASPTGIQMDSNLLMVQIPYYMLHSASYSSHGLGYLSDNNQPWTLTLSSCGVCTLERCKVWTLPLDSCSDRFNHDMLWSATMCNMVDYNDLNANTATDIEYYPWHIFWIFKTIIWSQIVNRLSCFNHWFSKPSSSIGLQGSYISREKKVVSKPQILSELFDLTFFGQMERVESYSVIQIRFMKTCVEIQTSYRDNIQAVVQWSTRYWRVSPTQKCHENFICYKSCTTRELSIRLGRPVILKLLAHLFMETYMHLLLNTGKSTPIFLDPNTRLGLFLNVNT